MRKPDAQAGCASRMPKPNARDECASRMRKPNAQAECARVVQHVPVHGNERAYE
jgi:hypothetical protein